jgi:hypothetical protein
MDLHKIYPVPLLTLLLLSSIIVGHFLPPTGILIIPIIVPIFTGIIFFTNNNFNIWAKSAIAYLFIGLNDIGLKLFAGGIHDNEGAGWINMLLMAGLVFSVIILVQNAIKDNASGNWAKILSILTFVLLSYIHLQLFQTLGMTKN